MGDKMRTESALLRQVQINLSKEGYRLFRNSVGLGYVGQVIDEARDATVRREIVGGIAVYRQGGGRRYLTLANARPMRFGLCAGSPDLIGWKRVKITPDMVGREVAVFVGIEGKTPNVRLTSEQDNFLKQIARFGGYAAVARANREGGIIFDVYEGPDGD
jgi:hypothetical protein